MNTINQLIEAAKGHQEEAIEAAKEIIIMGANALPDVVTAIKHANSKEALTLTQRVLLHIHTPEVVEFSLKLISQIKAGPFKEPNEVLIVHSAIKILSFTKDKKVLAFYREVMEGRSGQLKSPVCEALGIYGGKDAEAILVEFIQKTIAEKKTLYNADQFLSAIAALAKLGNVEYASFIFDFVQNKDGVIAVQAASFLTYVIAPGCLTILKKVSRNSYRESQYEAKNALFHLGTKEALAGLVTLIKKEDVYSSETIFSINALTGEELDEFISDKDLKKWWKENEQKYQSGICYRLGKPLSIGTIIEEMATAKNNHWFYGEELILITGEYFGLNPFVHSSYQDYSQVPVRAGVWWEENKHRFKEGKVYKFGYEQNINNI